LKGQLPKSVICSCSTNQLWSRWEWMFCQCQEVLKSTAAWRSLLSPQLEAGCQTILNWFKSRLIPYTLRGRNRHNR
jgi:hypothetical protein